MADIHNDHSEPEWDDEPEERPRRRRPRDDYDDDQADRRDGSSSMAVFGLILGILSILGCVFLTGIPAIILGVIARGKRAGTGMATAAIVLGTVGTLATVLLPLLLLPAVQKVREAAARAKDMNNLKQISLGQHNYHGVNNRLPAADGELSWRVEILPFIEQQNLYRQFKQNEPWDSPANRSLADVRVNTYVSALDPADSADTRYRVFVGPDTPNRPGRPPMKFAEIKDGTANTFMAVESSELVRWPQPKELPYDADGPLPALGHPGRDVVIVAFMDGAVRPIRKNTDTRIIRAAITPTGGEDMPKDW